MTDEEENINTALWPSEENIVSLRFRIHLRIIIPWAQVKALRDLVHNASPGDAFVFFCTHLFPVFPLFPNIVSLDAGHSGQQPATVDPNEIDGLDECPHVRILPAPRILT